MSRAQVEMMGLFAIIVILSIVFLVSLTLLLRNSPDYEEEYKSININSILSAILRTEFIENNEKIKLRDAIIDCDDSGDKSSTACGLAKNKLTDISSIIFNNKAYYLIIKSNTGGALDLSATNGGQIELPDSPCNIAKNTIKGSVKISPSKDITMDLYLCIS